MPRKGNLFQTLWGGIKREKAHDPKWAPTRLRSKALADRIFDTTKTNEEVEMSYRSREEGWLKVKLLAEFKHVTGRRGRARKAARVTPLGKNENKRC